MANTTDFISAVYDQLAKFLAVDASTSNLLQMAWPGYSLSPTDFRRTDAPNGPYDADVARETFSSLANIVPTLSKARFRTDEAAAASARERVDAILSHYPLYPELDLDLLTSEA